jgi:radical SAM protein with 4Fe4S-binding SPASM domain
MSVLPGNYISLMTELLNRAATRRQPARGVFELTSRCNLSCRMCYIRHSSGDCSVHERELPASAWLSLARQAVDNGLVVLLLTGGEVFLRPDFFEIYEPLTRMGLMLSLFSNGTLITGEIARRLAQSPPSRTEITLYGATAATYEAVTGVRGSYRRCCAGIEALVAQRVPLGLKTTITRQNVHELDAMQQMAHNWGAPFHAGWLLNPRLDRGPSDVEDCRLPVRECVALEVSDRASADELTEIASQGPLARKGDGFTCNGGKSEFTVTEAGEMNVCIEMPLPAIRVCEVGFQAAWNQLQRYVDSCPPGSPECLACDVRNYCPKCPARLYMWTGKLNEASPYFCEIAQTRKACFERHAESQSITAAEQSEIEH